MSFFQAFEEAESPVFVAPTVHLACRAPRLEAFMMLDMVLRIPDFEAAKDMLSLCTGNGFPTEAPRNESYLRVHELVVNLALHLKALLLSARLSLQLYRDEAKKGTNIP